MMSNGNEPQGELDEACAPDLRENLVEEYDPDLLATVAAVVDRAGGVAPLIDFLRERGDPRLGLLLELYAAECPWPLPAPRRGYSRLACGGGDLWEIAFCNRTGDAIYECGALEDLEQYQGHGALAEPAHELDDADAFDPEFDFPEHESVAEFDLSALTRKQLVADFEVCRQEILLQILSVDESSLRRWGTLTGGDIPSALYALRRPSDYPLEYVDPQLGWPARWLIALARRDPGRYAALMAALWADPKLRRAGYQVLAAAHPGWTAMLPGFAPPAAAEEIGALVRRGAVRRACSRLDELSPGWQAALVWVVRGTGGPLYPAYRPG